MENQVNPNFEFIKYGLDIEGSFTAPEILSDLSASIRSISENSANPFPVEVFPEDLQTIIKSTHESLNFPIDFIGSSLLYALSVAVGNSYRIKVKSGWVESALLYMAIVAPPGTNKSHPLSFAVKPIQEMDKIAYAAYEQQLKEFNSAVNMSKKDRSEQSLEMPTKPTWRKFLLTDFTPEALAEVHKFNKRGIAVYADELALWIKNFNRYTKGSEMEFWLSVWSGKPINVDRKTGEPVHIPMPYIPVCGTMQNGILNELTRDNRLRNGFFDRILFVVPDHVIKKYWSTNDLDSSIDRKWNEIMKMLLEIEVLFDETNNPIPNVISFSPEALQLLIQWNKDNTDQSNASQSECVKGLNSKIEIYAIRLALILEVAKNACVGLETQSVSLQSVDGALKLAQYFRACALKVLAIIGEIGPLESLPKDKQALYNALPDSFTTEEGLEKANDLNVPKRTFMRFLNHDDLFERQQRGLYQKKI